MSAAPTSRREGPDEHAVQQIVGRLLQVGVLVAAVVVVIGGTALLLQHGGATADYRVFRGVEAPLRSLVGIGRAALALDSRGVVQLGLVLLIATPIARVALTLVAFAIQRDRVYVALTAVVLALLLFGLLGGQV